MAMVETGLYLKINLHICARYKNQSEQYISFLSTAVYLPIFVFSLINNSTFVCRSRQMLFKLLNQTNIGFTGSIVHNHTCVITCCNR